MFTDEAAEDKQKQKMADEEGEEEEEEEKDSPNHVLNVSFGDWKLKESTIL